MDSRRSGLKVLAIALAICVSIGTAAWGQNPTGTLTGRVTDNEDGTPLPGVTVTATSPNLQGDRTTITGANGDYKLAAAACRHLHRQVRARGHGDPRRRDQGLRGADHADRRRHGGRRHRRGDPRHRRRRRHHLRDLDRAVDLHRGRGRAARDRPRRPQHRQPRRRHQRHRSQRNAHHHLGRDVVREPVAGQRRGRSTRTSAASRSTSSSRTPSRRPRSPPPASPPSTAASPAAWSTCSPSPAATSSTARCAPASTNQDWESTTARRPSTPTSSPRTRSTRPTRRRSAARSGRTASGSSSPRRDRRDRDQRARPPRPGIAFPQAREQERYEGKLTIGLTKSHTLIGSYLEIDDVAANDFFPARAARHSTSSPTARTRRRSSRSTTTACSPRTSSSRRSTRSATSRSPRAPADRATSTTAAPGRPSSTTPAGTRPNFCGECEQEVRNNENWLAKGSYFLSTESGGTHDFVFGYDTFKDIRFSVNHQSGSDFRLAAEGYFFDAENNVYPILPSGRRATAGSSVWPVFGLDRVSPTDFNTNSFYVNDRWQLNEHWSFNLGVRYDENDGKDAGGNLVTDDSKTSPRLARELRPQGRRRPGVQRQLRHLRGGDRQQPRRRSLDRRRPRPRDPLLRRRADQPQRRRPAWPPTPASDSDQATQMVDRLVARRHRLQPAHRSRRPTSPRSRIRVRRAGVPARRLQPASFPTPSSLAFGRRLHAGSHQAAGQQGPGARRPRLPRVGRLLLQPRAAQQHDRDRRQPLGPRSRSATSATTRSSREYTALQSQLPLPRHRPAHHRGDLHAVRARGQHQRRDRGATARSRAIRSIAPSTRRPAGTLPRATSAPTSVTSCAAGPSTTSSRASATT